MKEYKIKSPCRSFEEAETIRERVCYEISHKLSEKGQKVDYVSASVLFDPIELECIVKVEVF